MASTCGIDGRNLAAERPPVEWTGIEAGTVRSAEDPPVNRCAGAAVGHGYGKRRAGPGELVSRAGFEPATTGLKVRCSTD